MEARVKRRALCVMIVAAAACTKDLSSQPIISSSPPAAARAPAPPVGAPWRSELCRPTGPTDGALKFSGECAFGHGEPALCRPQEDDFYILVKRTLAGGQSFNFYVNVERHHGAGDYPGLAQIHVTVRDGQALYRWSNYLGTITLTGDSTKSAAKTRASLHGVRLTAEPGTLATGSIVVDGAVDCVESSEPPAQ
jgi:hypothetical protein